MPRSAVPLVVHTARHSHRLGRRRRVRADADKAIDAGRLGALEDQGEIGVAAALAATAEVLLLHVAVGVEPTAHPLRRGKRGSPFTTGTPPG